jgi:hypothetical protein
MVGSKVTAYTQIQWQLKFAAITIFILENLFSFWKIYFIIFATVWILNRKTKDYTD